MTKPRIRRARALPPWIAADYLLGFLLGLALGAMAIDHGIRTARSTPSPVPTVYPGP
jgi:hypothetical protein